MSIHSTSNNPIRLSGNNALTQEGAQNISKALTPFAHDHGVSKSISKLDTLQPRTVTSVNTSSAKEFFSSLADAICDICHNIRAFFSQSDETILAIKIPTDNLLTTLQKHQEEIKNLFNKAPNSNDAKQLRDACDMLQKTHDELHQKLELSKKLENRNKHDYNLAGDGRWYLEKTVNDMEKILNILKPNLTEEIRHDIHKAGEKIQQGFQKVGNFFENLGEEVYNKLPEDKKIEEGLNKFGENVEKFGKKIGKNAQKGINNLGKKMQQLGNKVKEGISNFINS